MDFLNKPYFKDRHYLRSPKASKQAAKVFVRNVKTKMVGDYKSYSFETPRRRSNVEENVFGSASFLTVITGIKESCSETNLES
ncbi:MAG: hypothetical protein PHX39_14520 [Bacteroidales bacterium]|nr:hypothetical protein [Bacteroidales bacterium]MDD4178150.1 hypothetical protein [Bacteroidales bacterium]MDD4741235.1 hypothetical protein [Bacteroidales bacterium]NCU35595.1 hypothetical protein [Candidatus Falkowbacteria bacterium]